jgi:hypothetical protein
MPLALSAVGYARQVLVKQDPASERDWDLRWVAEEGTCFDGVKNNDEADVDCGGRCPTCGDAAPGPCADPVAAAAGPAVCTYSCAALAAHAWNETVRLDTTCIFTDAADADVDAGFAGQSCYGDVTAVVTDAGRFKAFKAALAAPQTALPADVHALVVRAGDFAPNAGASPLGFTLVRGPVAIFLQGDPSMPEIDAQFSIQGGGVFVARYLSWREDRTDDAIKSSIACDPVSSDEDDFQLNPCVVSVYRCTFEGLHNEGLPGDAVTSGGGATYLMGMTTSEFGPR